MSRFKTFRVRFCVRDYYVIELSARSADAAKAIAQDLYERVGESRFQLDIAEGGPDEWNVEEVLP